MRKEPIKSATRSSAFTAVVLLNLAVWGTSIVSGQSQPRTIVSEPMDKDLYVSTDFKFTPVDGDLASLVGLNAGVLLNDKFLLGLAAYAKTSQASINPMGYGGFAIEYFLAARGATQFSFGGLVGGGSAYHGTLDFFVAEPQARLSFHVTRRLRLSLGGSYRFVGGASWANGNLDGPSVSLGLGFSLF